jgi:subtilisin family serine protease
MIRILPIKQLFIVAAIIWTLTTPGSLAGTLAPQLAERIDQSAPDEFISVWINLSADPGRSELKASLAVLKTRAERHHAALSTLRATAANSQAQLLAELVRLEQTGLATDHKGHWLGNIVEARVTAEELVRLSARSDVELIIEAPKVKIIEPETDPVGRLGAAGVESNLEFINADQAWAAGYTGAGRVICAFDNGVDGDHPALFDNWKGHDGDSAAAWFDPAFGLTFPHTISGEDHGTHTMGILVGHDDVTGDTIGVAPDAKWIAAGVIDVSGASIIDAFEWAADPDGDPNTIADVPDVINHSWEFYGLGCQDYFYELIDNTEALGIVNIFAAGNDGSLGAYTIGNPANRAEDSIDCFAVGNLNHLNVPPIIQSTSGLGPSDCNDAIKPNVVAPGRIIRSSLPGTGYGIKSGTSMAAPHVAGLVALLRQKSPNATVDEIKNAILNTADDYVYTLPDNTYGWGGINCTAALAAISPPSAPHLRVYDYIHESISPRDTVVGILVLENIGTTISDISVSITGSDPSLTVLAGSAWFGTIGAGSTVPSDDTIRVIVADSVTAGRVLSVDLEITDGGSYTHTTQLLFLIEPASSRGMATHDVGDIEFTITAYGYYGLASGSWFPAGGSGFRFQGGSNELYEGGLMIATGSVQVSDAIRDETGKPNGDFAVVPGGNIELFEPGSFADQETYSMYSDSRGSNPIGLEITQQSYSFASEPGDQAILLRHIIRNRNAYEVTGIYCGLFLNWDPVSYAFNAGGWETLDSILWTAYNSGALISQYRGAKVLQGPITTAHTDVESPDNIMFPEGFTEAEKWATMRAGFTSGETYKSALQPLFQLIVAGPFDLAAGAVDTVAFALLAGTDYADISAASVQAQVKYDALMSRACLGIRGNVDYDPGQHVDIRDLLYLVDFMFATGPVPINSEEADLSSTSDGRINIADLTYLVAYLYNSGPPPPSCP